MGAQVLSHGASALRIKNDTFVKTMLVVLVENQPTLTQLIEQSGLKQGFIAAQFGLERVSWYNKRKKSSDYWTVEDIYTMARILRKTPVEIFAALVREGTRGAIDQIPN